MPTPGDPAKAEDRGVCPTEEGAPGSLSAPGPRGSRPQALLAFPGGLSKHRRREVRSTRPQVSQSRGATGREREERNPRGRKMATQLLGALGIDRGTQATGWSRTGWHQSTVARVKETDTRDISTLRAAGAPPGQKWRGKTSMDLQNVAAARIR